jgi:hypothetical protein
MRRRSYLRTTGAGMAALASVAGLGGCLADGAGDGADGDGNDGGGGEDGTDDDPTIDGTATSLDLRYPEFRAAYYEMAAGPAGSGESAIAFEDLSTAARVEVANAVAREEYLTATPALLEEDGHLQPIAYRDEAFDVAVSVADRFAEPEYGPESGDDWEDPVAIEVATEDDALTVALRNVADRPVPVHHLGRPYFGVLIAVGDDPVPLEHDAYESNPHVREVGGLLRTADVVPEDRTTETLAPGEALTERYGIPEERPDEARIWIAARVGGESVDRLGNRRVTVAGTHELE